MADDLVERLRLEVDWDAIQATVDLYRTGQSNVTESLQVFMWRLVQEYLARSGIVDTAREAASRITALEAELGEANELLGRAAINMPERMRTAGKLPENIMALRAELAKRDEALRKYEEAASHQTAASAVRVFAEVQRSFTATEVVLSLQRAFTRRAVYNALSYLVHKGELIKGGYGQYSRAVEP